MIIPIFNIYHCIFRGEPWTMAPLSEPDPNKREVEYLDKYAQERWDTVLHYLVGSSQQSGVSLDAVKILLHSGLMTTDPNDSSQHHITKAGFQFLLMETSSQVCKNIIHPFKVVLTADDFVCIINRITNLST